MLKCLCGVLNSSAEFKAEDKYLTLKATLRTDQIQFFLQPTKCQVPVCKLCHRGRRQRDAQHHGQLCQRWLYPTTTAARSFGWRKQQTTLHCEEIVILSISESPRCPRAVLDTQASHVCIVKGSRKHRDTLMEASLRRNERTAGGYALLEIMDPR